MSDRAAWDLVSLFGLPLFVVLWNDRRAFRGGINESNRGIHVFVAKNFRKPINGAVGSAAAVRIPVAGKLQSSATHGIRQSQQGTLHFHDQRALLSRALMPRCVLAKGFRLAMTRSTLPTDK
jgi:hypothetical protein